MSKQVQEQRSPVQCKVFSAETVTRKWHYSEQEMQEKIPTCESYSPVILRLDSLQLCQ